MHVNNAAKDISFWPFWGVGLQLLREAMPDPVRAPTQGCLTPVTSFYALMCRLLH